MQDTPPVIYLIFNRPDLTEQSFEAIRQARPAQLHVVADGPRADRPNEAALCAAARAVTERIDWPCEVTRDYSATNMGCGRRVSSGITGGFERFEEAIILEDDCVPDPSFFGFCAEMLEKYKLDDRIMHITGSSFIEPELCTDSSYYLSKFPFIWGWATWSRAWKRYDYDLVGIEDELPDLLRYMNVKGKEQKTFFPSYVRNLRSGQLDTWDIQWALTCIRHHALSITPKYNLISNIGFGPNATHTKSADSRSANRRTSPIASVAHPSSLAVNDAADRFSMSILHPREAESPTRYFKSTLRKTYRKIFRKAPPQRQL